MLDQLSPGAILFIFGNQAADRDLDSDSRQEERELSLGPTYIHVPSGQEMLAQYLAPLLLSVGVWRLREEGLVELGPVRGQEGSCRFEVIAQGERPSVDGKLLETARRGERKLKTLALGGSAGAPGTLVWTVGGVAVHDSNDPYSTFCRVWRGEAVDAGAIRLKGLPGRRRPQADPATVAELEPRFEELMKGWLAFRDSEPELADAIRADADAGILQHFSPPTSG